MTEKINKNAQEFASRFFQLDGFDQADAKDTLKAIRQTTNWSWKRIWAELDAIKNGNASFDFLGNLSQDYLEALQQLAQKTLPPSSGNR